MNPKSYGKRCKCDHFESDHVNLNKKFYEPNASPETRILFHPPPTIDNPKISNAEDVHVITLVPKRKIGNFGNDK